MFRRYSTSRHPLRYKLHKRRRTKLRKRAMHLVASSRQRFTPERLSTMLLLVGGSALWYLVRRAKQPAFPNELNGSFTLTATGLHQLKQVFAALVIGVDLLERRLAGTERPDLSILVTQLGKVVRHGIAVLEPASAEEE